MPTFELFSKRKKRAAGGFQDVYKYDNIPEALRVQVVHIWGDTLGNPNRHMNSYENILEIYQSLVQTIRREYGVFRLREDTYDPEDSRYAFQEMCNFFLDLQGFRDKSATDKALDVIELTFKAIDLITRQFDYRLRQDSNTAADGAIEELNARFKEHGIGYYYSGGTIMRVDSELVHAEIVKPALVVLRQKLFSNAEAEFLAAHAHYRSGKNSEALVECYKAFESTMKIICTKRGWAFDKAKGAADLVRVCLDKGLIPAYWQSHFAGLRSVLESAIPTPRNKQAGHGAGADVVQKPPGDLVAYVLHMTAATILFLSEAERALQ
jgi:hypothetical protein